MKTMIKAALATTTAFVAMPASAAPLLYSYYDDGREVPRFTFILDDRPGVSALPTYENRDGFGVGVNLTLFWTTTPMGWGVTFYTNESGGGISALGAILGGNAVGPQLFRGSVSNPTMLTGRFNLVDQSVGTTAVLTVAAIPEPATWAMMLVGFGMVAGAARYRRRAMTITFA
ncbi:PEPxxWA-CTERM sorting domain-containing protein [Sphingomonas sp. CFBP 8760]|uniref:PEPxxWA-CTERM sorting domain-containing protein n=1 Tax=Sphingomonas sp. CFBP 8760 TaxID=2775282 RepID=UPI001782E8EA|nr:PEPxxWA-CTERM sorting domain-containing protein [Sphingomonas sp. CFBP 8760]MBD8546067.1 PEPxxWA-CTERM sorting domain-containing protein [Sphingomonas sp. CFBP 8760]